MGTAEIVIPLTGTSDPITADKTAEDPLAKLVFRAFVLYLLSFALEGPARIVLDKFHAGSALYLRDVVAAGTIALFLYRTTIRELPLINPVTVALLALLVEVIPGALNESAPFTAVFGMKMYLGFVFGLAIADLISERAAALTPFVAFILVTCVAGVALNLVYVFPWEGQAYDTAFGSVQATRVWFTGGEERRLSGFTRASYHAAMFAGVAGVYLLGRYRSILLQLLISALTLACVYLTTTKGMLLGFAAAAGWLIVWGRRPLGPAVARVLVLFLASLCIGLPFLSAVLHIAGGRDVYLPDFLWSFVDRFEHGWPAAFDLLTEPIQMLAGRGLGSIGTPQVMTGSPTANFGDNLLVYQYVVFGALSLVYLWLISRRILAAQSRGEPDYAWKTGMLLVLFAYGITANMFEEQFFGAFLGIAAGGGYAAVWRNTAPAAGVRGEPT